MRFNTNNHISLIPKRIPKLLNPYFLVYPIFDPSDVTLPETSVPFQGRRSLVFGSTSETWSVFFVGVCSGTRNDSLDVWVWERRNGWYLQMFGGQWMYVNVVFFRWRQDVIGVKSGIFWKDLHDVSSCPAQPDEMAADSPPRHKVQVILGIWWSNWFIHGTLWKKIHHHPFADSEGDRGLDQRSDKRWTGFDLDPSNSCCCCCVFKCAKPQKESTDTVETCNNLSMILLVYLFGACYFCDFHLASAQERQHESTWAFAFSWPWLDLSAETSWWTSLRIWDLQELGNLQFHSEENSEVLQIVLESGCYRML